IYRAIGALSNDSDLGVRLVDLSLLSGMVLLTVVYLKPFGRRVAACGGALWALAYLGGGTKGSLQREALIVPILQLSLLTDDGSGVSATRRIAAAALWGVGATVKPQAALGFPMIVAFECMKAFRQRNPKPWLAGILATAALGFAIPLTATLIYLRVIGALP